MSFLSARWLSRAPGRSEQTYHLPYETVVLERIHAFVQLERATVNQGRRELKVLLLHAHQVEGEGVFLGRQLAVGEYVAPILGVGWMSAKNLSKRAGGTRGRSWEGGE